MRTKLGRELAYQFIEPMVGGIQAGRIDDLSAKSVFPALLDAARKGGSLMKALRPSGQVNPGPASTTAQSGPLFYSLLGGRRLAARASSRANCANAVWYCAPASR